MSVFGYDTSPADAAFAAKHPVVSITTANAKRPGEPGRFRIKFQ
jgi:hypothetical protein